VHLIERQAQADLDRFKEFIESEQHATGAWRGSVESDRPVGTPGVEAAADSRGDDGKAGVSGKVVAAGVGVAAAAAAATVVGTKSRSDNNEDDRDNADVADVHGSSAGDTGSGSGAVGAPAVRMLTDEEIEAGASDVPLDASHTDRERP
jgi:hypothetical protein